MVTGTLLLTTALVMAPPAHKKRDHKKKHGHAHNHSFGDTDKYVAMFEDPQRSIWQKPAEVVGVLRIRAGQTVADIGAGSGYFTLPFARAVGRVGVVYAVDIEKGMLQHIKKRTKLEKAPNVRTIHAKPDDPKLPSEVDVVFICNTWHHIENRGAYLEKLKEQMGPGARLVIVDFYKKPMKVGPPMSMKLAEDDVIAEIEDAGFSITSRHTFLPHQYFLEFRPTS